MDEEDDKAMANPWLVESLYNFSYFCCPECPEKWHDKQDFVNHAFLFHPHSEIFLESITDDSLEDVEISEWQKEYVSEEFNEDTHPADEDELANEEQTIEGSDEVIIKTEVNEGHPYEDVSEISNDHLFENNGGVEFTEMKTEVPEEHLTGPNDEKPFVCKICGKGFSQKGNFHYHERIHTGEKPFPCDICGKSFNTKSDLKKHERIHTGEKPFACEICGKSFARSEYLKSHERSHTGEKPFSCEICGKSFKTRSDLKKHEKIHTGEKPFSCELCGQSFTESGSLKRHEQIHLGEKPFSCDICCKSFHQKYHLTRHEMTHTRVPKPFSCDTCGQTFTQKRGVKRHKCRESI